MAYQDYRNPCFLGKAQKHCGDFLYLAHRTRGGIDAFGVHCLYGVDYHQARPAFGRFRYNVVYQGFAVDVDIVLHFAAIAAPGEPVGPHLHLPGAFLAGDIQGGQFPCAKRNLQRQGALSYARLAAYEHQGARYHAPAEQPVHLGHAEADALFLRIVDFLEPQRLALGRYGLCHALRAGGALLRLHRHLLHRVPFPARGAPSQELGILVSAIGAVPNCLCLCHSFQSYKKNSLQQKRPLPGIGSRSDGSVAAGYCSTTKNCRSRNTFGAGRISNEKN